MSVVKIADDGGHISRDGWSHISVRAELTNATPDEVEEVRHLVHSIVAVMQRDRAPAAG